MNKFARIVRQNRIAIAGALAASAASSHAILPAGLTKAIEDYGVDIVAALGLMIGAGVLAWGTKKLGQKLGLL